MEDKDCKAEEAAEDELGQSAPRMAEMSQKRKSVIQVGASVGYRRPGPLVDVKQSLGIDFLCNLDHVVDLDIVVRHRDRWLWARAA